MGADFNQTVKAIAEAEAYPGPSLIIAYAPCINHGIKKGMAKAQTEEELAVKAGYWHCFRYQSGCKSRRKRCIHSGQQGSDRRISGIPERRSSLQLPDAF